MEPKTIDQAGIRTLIRERLENPSLYADRPVFIWQTEWQDGIQWLLLLHECMDFNRGKDREDWKVFKVVAVREEDTPLESPWGNRKAVGYALYTRKPPLLEEYLKEVDRLIHANNNSLPVIVYLPYKYQTIDLEGDHYIFIPPSDVNNHRYDRRIPHAQKGSYRAGE